MTKSMPEILLTELAEAVGEFLANNGGLTNGYVTYVKGKVSLNMGAILEWSTPSKNDLTGHEAIRLGRELGAELATILRAYKTASCEIDATHVEHGCYETTVRLCPPPAKVKVKQRKPLPKSAAA